MDHFKDEFKEESMYYAAFTSILKLERVTWTFLGDLKKVIVQVLEQYAVK